MNTPYIKYIYSDDNCFNVMAYITLNCNYRCEYCYVKNEKVFLNLKTLETFIQFLTTIIVEKTICIELIGGEPTLHSDMLDFCRRILSKFPNIVIYVYTNFSNSIDYYNELLSISKNISIIATWHSLPNDNINCHYLNIVKSINQQYYKTNNIELKIMVEQFSNTKCFEVFDILKTNYQRYLNISLLTIDNNNYICNIKNKYKYSKNIITKYKDYTSLINKNKKYIHVVYSDNSVNSFTHADFEVQIGHSFKRWICNIRNQQLFIDSYGNVYQCDITDKNIILNIYNNSTYTLLKKYFKKILCTYDICPCQWHIEKQNIFKY